MASSFTLADNARIRIATGSIMYFAQGVPMGLLSIAIPAWLASQGSWFRGQFTYFVAIPEHT